MKLRRIILAAATVFSLAAFTAGTVAARDMYDPKPSYHNVDLKDLFEGSGAKATIKETKHPIHDDATFEQLTTMHTVMPFERADLYFTMNLPKDWIADLLPEGKKDITSRIIGDIAKFSSPMIGTKKLRIVVQAVNVEHEISVSNWLRNYILTSGFAPDGDVIFDKKTPRQASIYFVNLEGGESFYNYITAQLSGNIMMLARFQAPQNLREYTKYLQKKTIDSFALTYPKESSIEEQKVFTMMDAIKLSVPASWEMVAPNFKDMNRLSVQIHNKSSSGSIDGFIMVHAIRRHRATTLMKEMDELKGYFNTALDVDITELVNSTKPEAGDRFLFKRYEIYNIESRRKSQSKQEVHLAVLGDREWYILLFLVTMREEERLYSWARNVQSFQEIIKSIK